MDTSKTITKILSIFGITSIMLFSPVDIYAQTVTSTPTTGSGGALQRIIANGDQYITQRLATLNALLPIIQNSSKLKTEDKNNFITQINTNISGLTGLKSKIDADTDVSTARADVQSIFTAFRIYAIFVPATHGLAAADAMSTTAGLMSAFETKLQSKVTEAASKGKDVTNLQTLLADMTSRLSDAGTQYSTVETQLSVLTPAGFNSNPSGTKATFQTATSEIQTGTQDLKTAWNDAVQIRQGLKALNGLVTPTMTPVLTQ